MKNPATQPLLPLEASPSPALAGLSVGQFLANKDRLARWCLASLVVSAAANALAVLLVLQTAQQPPWFVGFDPAGNPYSGRGSRFENARDLHVQQALDAATVLLYRSPNDFDFPERLPDLFSPPAQEAARQLKAEEAREFQDKALSQKALIARVDALETRPDQVRVAVEGKLVRRGAFHDQPFVEVIPFTLQLTFQFNPDLLRRGRFPTVVEDFQLRYEKPQ